MRTGSRGWILQNAGPSTTLIAFKASKAPEYKRNRGSEDLSLFVLLFLSSVLTTPLGRLLLSYQAVDSIWDSKNHLALLLVSSDLGSRKTLSVQKG